MADMQRRHYEFIADTIQNMSLPEQYEGARYLVAVAFAARLGLTNSQFKPDRFLKACGVEE